MERGRSINLALAARGIRALEHAGVMEKVRPLLIPMRGRIIHDRSGTTTLLPYGQRADEVIYSIGRGELNKVLIEEAARHQDVTIRFNQTCLAADPTQNVLRFRNEVSGAQYGVELTPTIGTDGAGSAVRSSLLAMNHLNVREDWLDHDYKELTIPPVDGRPALDQRRGECARLRLERRAARPADFRPRDRQAADSPRLALALVRARRRIELRKLPLMPIGIAGLQLTGGIEFHPVRHASASSPPSRGSAGAATRSCLYI